MYTSEMHAFDSSRGSTGRRRARRVRASLDSPLATKAVLHVSYADWAVSLISYVDARHLGSKNLDY